jgi:hypothetical protein
MSLYLLYLPKEILQQTFQAYKPIGGFRFSEMEMEMVPLGPVIVI